MRSTASAFLASVCTVDDSGDPFPRMRAWLDEGEERDWPCLAMMLATATRDGVPSVRAVCLRGLDDRGLRFFTHDGSRKCRELAENPRAAAMIVWSRLRRQLRVDAQVEPLPRIDAERYFATRPRGAQLAAIVSRQGRPSPGIEHLRDEMRALSQRYGDAPVPCPEDFVGYRLVPDAVEFWHGDDHRLHDRVVHVREPNGWRVVLLQP